MNDINSIQRIRWANVSGKRWYGFTTPITSDGKSSNYGISSPISKEKNWCNLTDQGRRIVNKLMNTKGIRYITASAFGIVVEIEPIYEWADYHDDIVELINKTLFAGKADVGPQGSRRPDEGLILWSGTRKSAVRWYGVSNTLRLKDKEKEKSACVISSLVDDGNWCNLTPEAREVVNTIFSMKGVFTVWVSAFDLSVEIAPVFSWSDYHDTIVKLLKDKIFGGKAFVEHKED